MSKVKFGVRLDVPLPPTRAVYLDDFALVFACSIAATLEVKDATLYTAGLKIPKGTFDVRRGVSVFAPLSGMLHSPATQEFLKKW